jgi:hypothetical protein
MVKLRECAEPFYTTGRFSRRRSFGAGWRADGVEHRSVYAPHAGHGCDSMDWRS